jgi:hypothetical protein
VETLCASIFVLPEMNRKCPARALWAELAHDVSEFFGDNYLYASSWGFKICLKNERSYSPDRTIVRYRTIEACIRRRTGQSTLLDLAVGNMFALAAASLPEPISVFNDAQYAKSTKWARQAGKIPLCEHVRLVGKFTSEVMDSGWHLEAAILKPVKISLPEVYNGHGVTTLPSGKFSSLARNPVQFIESGLDFAIVCSQADKARWARDMMTEALDCLLGSKAAQIPSIRIVRDMSPDSVNLVLLDDEQNLMKLSSLREELRRAEATGMRFKLAKLTSLARRYPRVNIAFDMFQIAGGRFWRPAGQHSAFCSIDAGHDTIRKRSRWVKVETDEQQLIKTVKVVDTSLAEHLPADLIDEMWPSMSNAILCRDGRFTQERARVKTRATAEKRPLIEVKKSPKAVLWHSSATGVRPVSEGEAIIDEHDEVLIQTVPQDEMDYIRPLRLSLHGGDTISLSTAFLHQQAMPGLSLYRMSRLPGALYFADLVSKMSADGWPKAIGRGFNIPSVVP